MSFLVAVTQARLRLFVECIAGPQLGGLVTSLRGVNGICVRCGM